MEGIIGFFPMMWLFRDKGKETRDMEELLRFAQDEEGAL